MYNLSTPEEVAKDLAKRHKTLRLLNKWKRTTMSERSGVTTASLTRFEQTGKVSLENLLRLFSALGRLDEVEKLLLPPVATSISDLEKEEIEVSKRGTV